jgi:hypothetical protein
MLPGSFCWYEGTLAQQKKSIVFVTGLFTHTDAHKTFRRSSPVLARKVGRVVVDEQLLLLLDARRPVRALPSLAAPQEHSFHDIVETCVAFVESLRGHTRMDLAPEPACAPTSLAHAHTQEVSPFGRCVEKVAQAAEECCS